jgi:cytidylate kinase
MLSTSNLSIRQAEAQERAQRHWESRRRLVGAQAASATKTSAITIALTREAGCPGTTVAREVGTRLGWPVYDHELLERIAQEMGLRVALLEAIDERRQNWILEALETFSAMPFVSENSYVRHLLQAVLSLGVLGECIIVGRGAPQILPRETTLRVRLVGELRDRIAAVSDRLGVSREEAARQVEQTDRERTRFIEDRFGADPNDPRLYDLLLNTSRWNPGECADLIVTALRQMQGRMQEKTK